MFPNWGASRQGQGWGTNGRGGRRGRGSRAAAQTPGPGRGSEPRGVRPSLPGPAVHVRRDASLRPRPTGAPPRSAITPPRGLGRGGGPDSYSLSLEGSRSVLAPISWPSQVTGPLPEHTGVRGSAGGHPTGARGEPSEYERQAQPPQRRRWQNCDLGTDDVTFGCTPSVAGKGRKELAREGWGTRYRGINSDNDLTKDPRSSGGLWEARGVPSVPHAWCHRLLSSCDERVRAGRHHVSSQPRRVCLT